MARESKPHYSTSANWSPMRLGEAIYRAQIGIPFLWICDNNSASSMKVMRLAKAYASRIGVETKLKVCRVLYEDESGTDTVTRAVIITVVSTKQGKAEAYKKRIEAGEIGCDQDEMGGVNDADARWDLADVARSVGDRPTVSFSPANLIKALSNAAESISDPIAKMEFLKAAKAAEKAGGDVLAGVLDRAIAPDNREAFAKAIEAALSSPPKRGRGRPRKDFLPK